MSTTNAPFPVQARMSGRRHRRIASVFVVLGVVLASCGSDDGGSTVESPPDAGEETTDDTTADDTTIDDTNGDVTGDSAGSAELVVATSALPNTFAYDGGTGQGYVNEELTQNTQAALLRNVYVVSDTTGEREQDTLDFEGELAEGYEVSDDGLVYTFTLREGILSHAGNELTVDDVLWSFERKFSADTSPIRSQMAPFLTEPERQLDRIDDYTFTATLDEAGHGFVFLSLMANYPGHIFDSDLLQEMATDDDPWAVAWSMENANYGFGPYSMAAFTSGQEMILEANPNWVFGEPDVTRVTYRVIEDPGTRANTLRSGDVDIAIQLRASDRADLAEAEGVRVYEFGTSNFLSHIGLVTTQAPFDDELVRQAFAHAIPYDQIIENTYYGAAVRVAGLMNPNWPNLDTSSYPDYQYDPETALELLAEAGYPDGGVEFTLTVENTMPDLQAMAIQVQSFASDAGFDVTIEELPPAAYTERRNNRELQAWARRGYTIVQAPYTQLRLFFQPNTGQTGWEDDAYYDTLLEGLAHGDARSPEATAAWSEAERIRIEAAPLLVVAAIEPLNAFREDIEGYTRRSDNTIDFSLLSVS